MNSSHDKNNPCPKCGSCYWLGPQHYAMYNTMHYWCRDCNYRRSGMPLDFKEHEEHDEKRAWWRKWLWDWSWMA